MSNFQATYKGGLNYTLVTLVEDLLGFPEAGAGTEILCPDFAPEMAVNELVYYFFPVAYVALSDRMTPILRIFTQPSIYRSNDSQLHLTLSSTIVIQVIAVSLSPLMARGC